MGSSFARSHEEIMKTAKKVFLARGYAGGNMRDIAHQAGFTQAALYRHFSDKHDMFCALVDPFLEEINEYLSSNSVINPNNYQNGLDIQCLFKSNAPRLIREFFPKYHDEFKLLLCCSKGTKYDSFLDEVVDIQVDKTFKAFEELRAKGVSIKQFTHRELHVLWAAYIAAICEPIIHNWPVEEIMNSLDIVEAFFVPGWEKILLDK